MCERCKAGAVDRRQMLAFGAAGLVAMGLGFDAAPARAADGAESADARTRRWRSSRKAMRATWRSRNSACSTWRRSGAGAWSFGAGSSRRDDRRRGYLGRG